MSPIVSLKAEEKLKLICGTVKKIREKVAVLRCCCFFNCFLSSVEKINTFFIQKSKIQQFLFLLFNMANNYLKCGIIYEKIAMGAGGDEWMINYEWSKER